MKNKKVVLSVLSAAVVSSMASSAFAAELKNGIYLGGNVDKFYSLSSFFSDANEEQAIAELEQIGGFSKTVFVVDGKAAFLNDYLKNDDAALQDPTPEMFADGPSYKEIDKDGNIVKVFEPVPPTGGDLVVESVSPIPDITVTAGATDAGLPTEVEVTFNDGTKGTKAVTWDTTGLDLNTPGTYTLTGDVADTDLTATVKVVVEAVELEVESVSATIETGKDATIYTNVDDDNSVKVVASAVDAEGKAVEGVEYSFTSSDENVATVAEDGTVTAIGDGTATITVKTTNAKEEKTATVDITVDTQLKVASVQALSARVLVVEFSTAVDASAAFNNKYTIYKSDFSTISPTSAEFVPGSNKKIKLTLPSDVELNTSYTLRVNNVNDADGVAIVDANKNYQFTTGAGFDTTKPAISGDVVASSSTKFTVTLNREIQDLASAKSPASYNLTKKSDNSTIIIDSVTIKTPTTLEFTVNPGTKLVNGATYQLDVIAGAWTDIVGNTNDAVSNKEFVGVSDATAPVLQEVLLVDADEIELKFNENVELTHTNASTANVARVALFEVTADGDEYIETVVDGSVDGTEIEPSDDANHDASYAKVDIASTLEAGKTYKVVAQYFENDDDVVASNEQTKTFTIDPIIVSTASKTDTNKITYTFSQKPAANTGTFNLYKLNKTTDVYEFVETITPADTAAAASGNDLTVTYVSTIDAGETYKTIISGVEYNDYAGVADNSQQTVVTTVAAAEENKVTLLSAAQKANQTNVVTLTFDKNVDPGQTSNVDIELYKGSSSIPVLKLDNQTITVDTNDHKKADLTLTGITLEEGVSYKLKVKDVKTEGSADTSVWTQVSFTGKDYAAPAVSSATLKDGNKLVLTFSEAVDISGASFKLLSPTGTYVNATAAQSADKKTVTLTASSQIATAWDANEEDQVTLTGVIKDTTAQANQLNESGLDAELSGLGTYGDQAKPVALKAEVLTGAEDDIVVTFSEVVADASLAADGSDFNVTGIGTLNVQSATANGDETVTVTLDGDIDSVPLNQGNIKISLADGTILEDTASPANAASAFANLAIVENVAPTIVSATASGGGDDDVKTGDAITLVFSEELLRTTLTADDITINLTDNDGVTTETLTGSDISLAWTNDYTLVVTIEKAGVNIDVTSGGGEAATIDIAASSFQDKSNVDNDVLSTNVVAEFQS